MRLVFGHGATKLKSIATYLISLALVLGSIGFAAPQFFGQIAHAVPGLTATVTQTGNSKGGEIVYSFSEPVQLMNATKTAPILASEYASSLGIYEYGDYSTHSLYQDDVAKVGKIDSAVLSNDETEITIEYTGNLEGTTDMRYVVDAWGLNITDLDGNKMAQNESQMFIVKAAPPTMTKQAEISGKTITYTFSEPMQLVKQDDNLENRVATDFSSDKLGIYAVTNGNYNVSTKANVTIDASLSNDKTVLSVTYTGNLEKQVSTQYVIDAWGYDITDLAGNVISKAELSKALFTVTGDTTAPIITIGEYSLAPRNTSLTVTATTNEGELYATNHTFIANGSFDFIATDIAGNVATKTVTINSFVKTGQTVPDNQGNVILNATIPEVIIADHNQAVVIDSGSTTNTKISVTALMSLVGGKQTGVLPKITITSDVADVTLPDQTTVTGPSGWDGIIDAPTAGTPTGGQAPAGFSVGGTVISVGSESGTLLFDKAVTIVLPGVTGTVGYRASGSNQWVVIYRVCNGTYANPTGAVYPGECAISNGTDTKILTFHFTSFGKLLAIAAPVVVARPIVTNATTTVSEDTSTQAVSATNESIATLTANDESDSATAEIKGATDTKIVANDVLSLWGLAWYWWLGIVAVIILAWWMIGARLANGDEN